MDQALYHSRIVRVGDLEIGGDRPIRVQSMTNTPTMDTAATVRQVTELARSGCELVRITARNLKEALHLETIKKELQKNGINIPLAADIHFQPEAAEMAARMVEKVRINPGNYADRARGPKKFSDREYNEELDRIASRLAPLLKICKEHGTALRIGTNHGSLSERISYHFGNGPEGMVESALEYARICRDLGFHQLVFSMKASNILTVLHSNRLLVAKMIQEGMDYPIHLGVTEAGAGEDARIKSAAGIGILLSEGIGDTIRVSLTEDPVKEIPFARKLAVHFREDDTRKPLQDMTPSPFPYHYRRHPTRRIGSLGGDKPPEVLKQERFPAPASAGLLTYHSGANESAIQLRKKVIELTTKAPLTPVIVVKDLGNLDGDELLICVSTGLGMILTDGFGDGIGITGGAGLDDSRRERLALDILQATGRRISKTEYIACPSCGRTLFDIEKALQQVKERTSHLVGLKIAVMGCIVNGPGEMADADYGYVGAGPGKVHIYKGHELVKKNVPQERALDELLEVINRSPGPG